jgi:hypothetical protein
MAVRSKSSFTSKKPKARQSGRSIGKKKSAIRNARVRPSAKSGRAAKSRAPKRPKPAASRPSGRPAKTRETDRAKRRKQQALVAKERERARLAKERERARLAKEREQARVAKEREQARLAKDRERTRLAKDREQTRLAKERERTRVAKEREQARLAKHRDAEKARLLKERETARQALEQARENARAQRLGEREAAKVAREQAREKARAQQQAEREAAKVAREQERQRIQAERERQRDETRRAKEEERARKDAERETYRKAKEAERERLRAEREAARRALEGKVARASKRAHRADGLLGRSSTARLYRADAIPDQSGTTRRTAELESVTHAKVANLRAPSPPWAAGPFPSGTSETLGDIPLPGYAGGFEDPGESAASLGASAAEDLGEPGMGSTDSAPAGAGMPSPAPKLETASVEDREISIEERLANTDEEFRRNYLESLDMSWIYHDSAREGVVYTFQELKTAIDPNITVVPDSSLQPVCEEIRRHKAALDLVRELAQKKKEPITVDTVKRIYLTLHPEEGDLKSVKYRKDIPQHRLYFHEYAPPDKIAYKVRQVVDWLNGPEPKKIKNPVRIAGRVHYDLLRVFPFPTDSGKVARLLMNLVLIRSGYPPAIVHSTERQRYYEALKGALPVILAMVNEAIQNGLLSIEKILDEQETRMRSFVS